MRRGPVSMGLVYGNFRFSLNFVSLYLYALGDMWTVIRWISNMFFNHMHDESEWGNSISLGSFTKMLLYFISVLDWKQVVLVCYTLWCPKSWWQYWNGTAVSFGWILAYKTYQIFSNFQCLTFTQNHNVFFFFFFFFFFDVIPKQFGNWKKGYKGHFRFMGDYFSTLTHF